MIDGNTEYKKVLKQIKDYEPGGDSYGETLKYFIMSPNSYEALKKRIVDNKILGYPIRIKNYLGQNNIYGIAAEYDRIIYDDDEEYYKPSRDYCPNDWAHKHSFWNNMNCESKDLKCQFCGYEDLG